MFWNLYVQYRELFERTVMWFHQVSYSLAVKHCGVQSLRRLSVLLCPHFMSSFYVFILCILCLHFMSSFYVFILCLHFMYYFMSSFYVFILCIYFMSSFYVFILCLHFMSSFQKKSAVHLLTIMWWFEEFAIPDFVVSLALLNKEKKQKFYMWFNCSWFFFLNEYRQYHITMNN